MEDLDWLGETARAHHRVVERVSESTPTAPVRLVTVYRNEKQVRLLLERRHDDFLHVLDQVAGRQEWGVKAYVDAAASPVPGGESAESAADRPGTAYLRRRQATLRTREEAWRHAVARAEHIHAVLGSLAVASRRHRPQDPQLTGRTEWMVLNGAYLVDRDLGEDLARAVDALREPGIELELTGPWAPYSFTALVEGPEAEGRDDRE
jgi:hypothetical protein